LHEGPADGIVSHVDGDRETDEVNDALDAAYRTKFHRYAAMVDERWSTRSYETRDLLHGSGIGLFAGGLNSGVEAFEFLILEMHRTLNGPVRPPQQ
jgi:hypothetical protein